MQSESLLRIETRLFINYNIKTITNGNQRLWRTAFDLFCQIRFYIHAGHHHTQYIILTVAGNVETVDSPDHRVGKTRVGAYYGRIGTQVQLQIFPVSIFLSIRGVLVHECEVYMKEYSRCLIYLLK